MAFVPTHKLISDIPELHLKAGALLRQINPFAAGRDAHLMMLEEVDYLNHRQPWILTSGDVEPLDNWNVERAAMMECILNRCK